MTNGLRLRVAFFKTEGGREPVREWLLTLPRAERQVIGTDLLDVQYGWPVGMPLVRKLEADLWEVRSTLGDHIARVLFTIEEKTLVALHDLSKNPSGHRKPISSILPRNDCKPCTGGEDEKSSYWEHP